MKAIKTLFSILVIGLPILALNSRCAKEPVPLAACASNTFPVNKTYVQDSSSIVLTWSPCPGATGYDVYLGPESGAMALIASDLTSATFTYDLPIGTDITYSWYVQPKNSTGATDCSQKVTSFTTKSLPDLDTIQHVVNVLVLNFDPKFAGGAQLHKAFSWSDPHELAEGYMQDVLTSSGGLIKYNIVEWKDIDEYPVKADGFRYNDSTYMGCIFGNKSTCHNPDDFDYYKMIKDYNIVDGINQDVYEEVWIFGAPYFGFWESAMAGPGAFYINGGIYNNVATKKAFAIMGFSYERGVAEMVHDLCHRSEATMSLVYGGWEAEKLTTSWARFAANQKQSGVAAVGTCHFPPNAVAEYDYANVRLVSSSADDWFNYPLLSGKMTMVNSTTWGSPDFQRKYLHWWFNHLPRRVGETPDGKLNSWWRYIFDFNTTIL